MTNNKSRRNFLLQAGGAALALPFLPSLLPRAMGAGGRPPKRFIAISHRYGHHFHHFFPSNQADIRINDNTWYKKLSDIPGNMSPVFTEKFDPFRSKMNIICGMDSIGGGGHNSTVPLNGGSAVDGSENSGPKYGRTIDVLMSRSRSVYDVTTKFDAIRMSNNCGDSKGISWDRDASGNPLMLSSFTDDQSAFNSIFEGYTPGSTSQADSQKQKLIIDQVFERYKALRDNPRMSTLDRQRFEQHIATVTDLQMRLQLGGASCSIPKYAPYQEGQMTRELLWHNQVDNLISAMACDLTRVGVLYVADFHTGLDAQNYGNAHAVSHDRENNEATKAISLDYSHFKADQILYLLQRMSNIVESDGTTMLDNSLILLTAELGETNFHKPFSLPTATFGGCQGAIHTGYLMDFRLKPLQWEAGRTDFIVPFGQSYNRLLITCMRAMGMQASEYLSEGDGAGFGEYAAVVPYTDNQYKQYVSLRNDPLPIIFG